MALIDDFNGRWRETPNGTVWHLDPSCRLHQMSDRHRRKAANPALYILTSRADTLARKAGTTRNFILYDSRGPSWIRLLPLLDAFLKEHADCVSCGHKFDADRDTQLDHIHPPRSIDDWARHCARNIRILCGTCNGSKQRKADDVWVDEQYRRQLATAARSEEVAVVPEVPVQLSLLGV